MAFLDNSGDIILDAVLTDTGRMRLAKGDGTFRIAKFALGDDEVDYSSFNKDHASGSAYFDLEILQMPVFEAFTDNTSVLKTKLISIPRTNLLYLPVLKLNENSTFEPNTVELTHVVAVDEVTEVELLESATPEGVLKGENPENNSAAIKVDQGLDTDEIPPTFTIDSDLYETQYIIEIDNRLGQIVNKSGAAARVSFIDDDNIASYYLSQGSDPGYISSIGTGTNNALPSVILGPRGSRIEFKIKASIELNTSTFLFTQLGSTKASLAGGASNYYYIDTMVRVTGATTGYRIDIPVRFAKKV